MEKKHPQLFSGVFVAAKTPIGPMPPVLYSDDDHIIVQKFPEEVKVEDTLRVSLKFCFDYIQLSSTKEQEVPVCLFLENGTQGNLQTGRPGVDIVFVIDLSGSMMGPKLELVKKTLEFMIMKLGPSDRVALVTFNNACKKLCGLTCMTDPKKQIVNKLIGSMNAYGGTEIVQGLDMALRILAGRKVLNSVSSIVMLSDGKDNNSHSAMSRTKEILLRSLHEIDTGFSIHTFGYGADHDAALLNAMADEKNGGFYYIEHEEAISTVFSNCLGELISVVADNIQVVLTYQPTQIPCELGKVYSENSTGNFRMPPVLSGDSKEAVFLLQFPPCPYDLDQPINISPIKATVTYKVMKTGRTQLEEIFLNIPVYPERIDIEDISLEADVLINFYRVKAVDVMKEATALADRGNIQQARNILGTCAEELRTCAVSDTEVIVGLLRDIQETITKMNSQVAYDVGGRADIMCKANNHWAKRAVNVNTYQNHVQVGLNLESANYFKSKH